MKKITFPSLFAVLLLGLWMISKNWVSGSTPTTTPSSPPTTAPSPSDQIVLSQEEEVFAASLNPQNQTIFIGEMTKKDRTMAMELMNQNHRNGGKMTSDEAVEQIASASRRSPPPAGANQILQSQPDLPPQQGAPPVPVPNSK